MKGKIVTGAILFLYWAMLAWLGMPFPQSDDGAFIGSALNIGRGGDLVNPLMELNGPFFLYPPLHAYFWGGYLKLAGISSLSLVLFHTSLCIWISWNLVETCRLLGKAWVGWCLVAMVTVHMAAMGLRPDVSGFFWMSIGFYLGAHDSYQHRVAATFFSVLAVATHPAMVALALPWLLYLIMQDRRLIGWVVLSGVAVGAIFYAMIGGQVRAFWDNFMGNAAGTSAIIRENFMTLALKPPGLVKFFFMPAVLLSLMVIKICRTGFDRHDALLLIALVLGFVVSSGSLSGQRVLVFILAAGAILCVYQVKVPEWVAWILIVSVTSILFAITARPLLSGITAGKPVEAAALAQRAEVTQASRVLVDWWALRYVFDYQIRPGMLAFGWAGRPHNQPGNGLEPYPDECWILSATTINYYRLSLAGLPVPQPLRIGGRPVGEWILNAGEIGVLPASSP